MSPKDFLQTAERLLSTGTSTESDWRSAVSRAYYAVYLVLKLEFEREIPLALLQQSGLGGKNRISHERLPTTLKSSSNAQLSPLGDAIEALRLARIDADYMMNKTFTQPFALDQFENARELLAEIEAYGAVRIAKLIKEDIRNNFKI